MRNRKIILVILLVCCFLICNKSAFGAVNYTEEIDEIDPNASSSSTIDYGDYSYMLANGRAYIVDYRGKTTELVLPSTIDGYQVYGLYSECFANGTNLKKIYVPSCVKVIYPDTFFNCRNLEEVEIDKNNDTYASDDGMVYSKDFVYFVSCPEGKRGEVTLRDETLYICDNSFLNASKVTIINVPENVFDVGILALYNTSSLEKINIDKNNDYFVFLDGILYNKDKTEVIKCVDTRKSRVNIASSVKSIRDYAFYNCKDLPGPIEFPEGLEEIGEGAFFDCHSLSGTIDFPSSLLSIDKVAFFNCYSIEEIDLNCDIEIIPDDCFGNCSSLKEIVIPNNIREIGERAFFNCIGVESISLGNSLRIINNWAFDYLTRLKGDLIIPDSVNKIGDAAFFNSVSLDGYIVIGAGVHEIGASAFYRADNVKGIIFRGPVPSISEYTFLKPDVPYYYLKGRTDFEGLIEGKTMLTYVEKPKVTFIANGTKYKEVTLQKFGLAVDEFDNPEFNNYNFEGWYYDENYENEYNFSDTIMDDTIIYAKLSSKNKIEFAQDTLEIEAGYTKALEYSYNLEDGATIVWNTSDSDIVEVDQNGNIKAKKEGQAVITASYNNIVASITINVLKETNKIKFDNDILNIIIDEKIDINFSYHLLNGADVEEIVWSSSDNEVATVENGQITAIKEGKTIITATYEDASDTIEIYVLKPNSLYFTCDVLDVPYRNNSKIEFDLDYYFNDGATDKDIIYESNNQDIIKVVNNELEIVGTGKVTIKASYKDVSDTIEVNIFSVDKLEFNSRGYIIKVGESINLDYTFDSYDQNESDIVFTSSDENVATVQNGKIVAKSKGKAVITATYNELVSKLNIVVSDENYMLGDINYDGVVNANDAALVLDIYKYGNATDVQKIVADVNFDSVVNANDAALILDIYKYGM